MSLHIFLHLPSEELESQDPLFGPYISILPRQFDAHPLTWVIKQRNDQNPEIIQNQLLEDLPPSVTTALENLENRFWADWKIIRKYVEEHRNVLRKKGPRLKFARFQADDHVLTLDFACAWLNVNTRCIYHRLKASRSDPDNITLCPILDFANHNPILPHALPSPSDAGIWNTAPRSKLGDDFTLMSPANSNIEQGQELYLCYGAHANRTLFVEYGFVNEFSARILSRGEFHGEVDVQELVEHLFDQREAIGKWMRGTLENEGYWGNWTLHSSPTPHPSYRLITALRLYCILPICSSSIPLAPAEVLRPWRETMLGKRDCVSEENERSWRETVLRICTTLAERAASYTSAMAARNADANNQIWIHWMQGNIRMLWEEEGYVAAAVERAVRNGEQF